MASPGETAQLLLRWHGGDREALQSLLEREMGWIEARVRKRLGPLLRVKAETGDFVQEAALELLRYGSRLLLANRAQFRGLLLRIVENVLRDEHDRFTAFRRAARRERPLPSGSGLGLAATTQSPSRAAEEEESECWIHLALELLEPEDRKVILLREWAELSFEEVGRRLLVSADAARMRFHRALARLSSEVQRVKSGRLGEHLEKRIEPDDPEGA
jgi:RNA polymerase sigma factor (sigma-70 family)